MDIKNVQNVKLNIIYLFMKKEEMFVNHVEEHNIKIKEMNVFKILITLI